MPHSERQMSKEQSTRMFNEFSPSDNIIKWTNGAGLTVAVLDLMRIPGYEEHAPLPDTLPGLAMVHGFTQKVADAAALGIVDGRRPTWTEKSKAMAAVIDALYAGSWNTKREAGGMLRAALERLADKGSKKAREYLDNWVGMDEDVKKSLSKSKLVQQTIAEIRAERAEPADDLIDDL